MTSSCLIRRVISRSGRSRAWINGTPVTLNQLQDLGSLLVEIHGQNEHIRLNQYGMSDSACWMVAVTTPDDLERVSE